MSDDLEDRKKETWGMDEVRSTGASSESQDTSDTADTEDTSGKSDGKDTSDTPEGSDASIAVDSKDASDDLDTTDASDTSDIATGETVRQMAIDAEKKGFAVRDLHNVNVYLYEEIYREMVTTFKKLDSDYFQEHGDELSKNKEFFNAVFRAGLQSPQLREELDLK
ncbi:hypothetical protein [Salinigranum rubrum]|nr:hypothetical protein [Salinigranum rubrum]